MSGASIKNNEGICQVRMSRRRALGLLGSGSLALAASPSFAGETMREASKRRPSLNTRLTHEYRVQYPLVCAGMAFVGMPRLAAAVANAGGIGMLGAAPEAPPGVLNMIQATRALTDKPFGVNFIVDTTAFGPMTTDAHIDVCVAAGVKLVTFHWNPPERHWVDALHLAGAKAWFQTGLVEQAHAAVDAGVDGIIVQGSQAGGHVRATTRTLTTLEEILSAVPRSIIILAAGGIADGRDVVKALARGADGVWVGTRFAASVESNAHDEYKHRVVNATGQATVHTTLFGPEWPGQRIRVLRNRVVKEWAGRENEIPSPPPPPAVIGQTRLMPNTIPGGALYDMPKFSAMLPTPETIGDFEEMCMPAGESVRVIKAIKPAAEIIAEMMAEARSIIDDQSAMSELIAEG
jgi:NAD(P)H-dependent flavin oxidoreductase YrpB (nitropropane dioxygenase family)